MITTVDTSTGILILNLPPRVAACPFRVAVYRDLMDKPVHKFTEADHRAWTFATGWTMQPKQFPVKRHTARQLWGAGVAES